MNFALLGGADPLLPLLRGIASDPRHRLTVAAGVPASFTTDLLQAVPGVRLVDGWQELLDSGDLSAVIAVQGGVKTASVPPGRSHSAGGSDGAGPAAENEEGIRQLASAGKPILLVPDGDPASALVYELTLVRADVHVPLIPLFPLRYALPVERLRDRLRDGSSGRALNLQMNRMLRVTGSPPLLTAGDVLQALIDDADLLRQLGGEYDQVTAVYSGPSERELSLATVTLAGPNRPTATWTVRPVSEPGGFELTATTEKGSVTLRGKGDAGAIPAPDALSIGGDGIDVGDLQAAFPADVPQEMLQRLAAALSQSTHGEDESDTGPSTRGARSCPTWSDLTRAFDIVEAASRSVRRRRTIDLHFEETSERSQFKTQMTAIGCALMMMTLFSFVFLLMAGGLFNLHPVVLKIARIGIFVPLALFLLLQLLLFISRPARVRDRKSKNEDAE